MKKINVGTSGWSYAGWKNVFYPTKISSDQQLSFYAQHFKTVEINSTFYHLPKESTVDTWNKKVSNDFIFSIKASRYITHIKRLNECKESLKLLYTRLKPLNDKLGIILYQLPPSFQKNMERLEEFVSHLNPKIPSVFEFRHTSWFSNDVYEFLKKNDIALCITDIGGKLTPIEVTSRNAYIRLHGPKASYQGSYGKRRLNTWKKRIECFYKDDVTTFCYFDNDEKGFATKDAAQLIELFKADGYDI